MGIFGQSRGKIKIHERKTSNETLHKGAFQQNKARARRIHLVLYTFQKTSKTFYNINNKYIIYNYFILILLYKNIL